MLQENLLFVVVSTAFLSITGWYWRDAKPYSVPQPIPNWFKAWFVIVQSLGGLLPIITLILWGIWWNHSTVLVIFASYLVILGLQILAESLSLRRFESVVWVMIPYLYIPYRVWQLYQGFLLIEGVPELMAVRVILWINIIMWSGNYVLNLVQLPFLFRWQTRDS